MKIMDFLCKDAIIVDLKSTKKEDVIKELIDALIQAGQLKKIHRDSLIEAVLAREKLGSTAIGQGVAIPHAKSEYVEKLIASLGISSKGIDFDSLDDEPVYIVFLLLSSQDSAGPHLKALALISRVLKDKYFRENLRNAKDSNSIVQLIIQEDEKKI